jgi:hypothetical protein
MRNRMVTGMVVAVMAAVSIMVAPTAAQAAPYCGIHWGSMDKAGEGVPSPGGPLTDVRAGQHDCYDRLVIDFDGGGGHFDVHYVPGVPYQGREGDLSLRGGAFLQVALRTVNDDTSGAPTYVPSNSAELVNVGGWRTLRQVAWDSFEGYTTIGIGVRARLPFRAFTLPGPGTGSRLVIDVAHQW